MRTRRSEGRLAKLLSKLAPEASARVRQASDEVHRQLHEMERAKDALVPMFEGEQGRNLHERIWRGIVWFVNKPKLLFSDGQSLSALNLYVCPEISMHDQPAWFLQPWDAPEVDEYVRQTGEPVNEALPCCLRKYQQELRTVLLWMCDREQHLGLAPRAFGFLFHHSQLAAERFEENRDPHYPIHVWRYLEYKSLIAPICKFLWDCLTQSEQEIGNLDEIIPIQECSLEDCHNFFLPERRGCREYCSDRCRSLQNMRSKGEQTDYMFVYRAAGLKPKQLREYLTKKRMQRLAEIEREWGMKSTAIAKNLTHLKQFLPAVNSNRPHPSGSRRHRMRTNARRRAL